jgi:PBP1b-binding outer membrane lipoprotein LpoB
MNTKSTFFAVAAAAVLFTGCSSSTDALRNVGGHKEDIIVNKPDSRNPNTDVDARDRNADAVFNVGGHKEDIIVNKPD